MLVCWWETLQDTINIYSLQIVTFALKTKSHWREVNLYLHSPVKQPPAFKSVLFCYMTDYLKVWMFCSWLMTLSPACNIVLTLHIMILYIKGYTFFSLKMWVLFRNLCPFCSSLYMKVNYHQKLFAGSYIYSIYITSFHSCIIYAYCYHVPATLTRFWKKMVMVLWYSALLSSI